MLQDLKLRLDRITNKARQYNSGNCRKLHMYLEHILKLVKENQTTEIKRRVSLKANSHLPERENI